MMVAGKRWGDLLESLEGGYVLCERGDGVWML